MKVEAKYYTQKTDHVECRICPHFCKIKPDKWGICRGRKNDGGKLWATNYGETTSIAMDPIEKKPLYHYFPGSQILSIACNSCNMRCPFCQNWEISQVEYRTQYLSPEILQKMLKDHESMGVAYTYTEPLMWFEYLIDAGRAVHDVGGKNILVTGSGVSGFIARTVLGSEPAEVIVLISDRTAISVGDRCFLGRPRIVIHSSFVPGCIDNLPGKGTELGKGRSSKPAHPSRGVAGSGSRTARGSNQGHVSITVVLHCRDLGSCLVLAVPHFRP